MMRTKSFLTGDEFFKVCLKLIACLLTFIGVLSSGIASKGSLLFIVSQMSQNATALSSRWQNNSKFKQSYFLKLACYMNCNVLLISKVFQANPTKTQPDTCGLYCSVTPFHKYSFAWVQFTFAFRILIYGDVRVSSILWRWPYWNRYKQSAWDCSLVSFYPVVRLDRPTRII